MFRFSFFTILLLTTGCFQSNGPNLIGVTGVVTRDGAPAAGVFVQFYPEQGRTSFGKTDDQGEFELAFTDNLDGAIPGAHTVEFELPNTDIKRPVGWNRMSEGDQKLWEQRIETIRLKHTEEVLVSAENDHFEFDLTGKK